MILTHLVLFGFFSGAGAGTGGSIKGRKSRRKKVNLWALAEREQVLNSPAALKALTDEVRASPAMAGLLTRYVKSTKRGESIDLSALSRDVSTIDKVLTAYRAQLAERDREDELLLF